MVSDLLSSQEGSGGENTAAPLKKYIDVFEEMFPHYLSIGMTEEQYWDKDCNLVTYYRKAESFRMERKNQDMWLQGAYFYEALCRVSPILNAFAKKGTKPSPYPEKPYALQQKDTKDKETDTRQKSVYEKGKRMIQAFMAKHNKKFEKE